MGKPTICIGENKGADQLRGNREADQRLCFRYSDSTLPPLLNSKISSFKPASVAVQAGLCQTCSETTLLVFPRGGSFIMNVSSGLIHSLLQCSLSSCNYSNGNKQHCKTSIQMVGIPVYHIFISISVFELQCL